MERLTVILQEFNDLYGNVTWTNRDRIARVITEEIPPLVASDRAYQNAVQQSDAQNARIELDRALQRVMVSLMTDQTELFKKFSDEPDFKRWLADKVFALTYQAGPALAAAP